MPNTSPPDRPVNGTHATTRPRSMTLGVFLTSRWLPTSDWCWPTAPYDEWRGKVDRHVLPAIGAVALRRLRAECLELL